MSDETFQDGGPRREMSTVQFPYNDLDDAISVARAILSAGGVPLDRDQLAAALGISPSGGNFAIKLSGARMFGLIESVAQGRYQLSELGFEVLDPARERAAKAVAFLNVELYRKAFDAFKGKSLPPRPHGLENAFVQFGVSAKQKDRARNAFDRSARSAGFFPNGNEDRLVQPVLAPDQQVPRAAEPPREPEAPPEMAKVFLSGATGMHPFVQGLLRELPPEKTEWDSAERAKWLQAAAQIFDLIYTGGGGAVVVEVRGAR